MKNITLLSIENKMTRSSYLPNPIISASKTMKNTFAKLCLFVLTFGLVGEMMGQINITSLPANYSNNFDSYNPSTASNVPSTINSTGTSTAGLASSTIGWTASSTTAVYNGKGTGSGNTGGFWGYNVTGNTGTENSLGALSSGSNTHTYTISFTNNSGSTITSLTMSWDYEQWRYGGSNTSGWDCSGTGQLASNSTLNGKDFSGVAGTAGATGGLTTAVTSFTLTGLSITNGQSFGISWVTTNLTGTDNGVAIDNFLLSASGGSSTPLAPTIGTITPGNQSLSVAFTAGGDGGSAITSYKYSTDGGTTFRTRAAGTTASPISITTLSSDGTTALTNGTSYNIQIKAVNANGDGTATASTAATPYTTPSAPTIGTITPGNQSLSVGFTAGATGGSAITSYKYSTDGGVTFRTRQTGTTGSPILITTLSSDGTTALTNGTSYNIQIKAVNAGGDGLATASTSATPYTTPGAPTVGTITPGNQSLSVAFTSGNSGGSAITSYKYSTDGGVTFRTRQSGTTASPIAITTLSSDGTTALTNGTSYNIQIKAVNVAGDGSATASTAATPYTTPSAPIITGITAGNTQLSVAFTAPNNNGSTITNYQYSTDAGSTFTPVSPSQTTSPIVITGLTNDVTYDVQLKAVNAAGAGTASTTTQGTPVAPTSPSIASSGTPSALSTNYGTPSSNTSFSISGTAMQAGITVTPPLGFEVSTVSDFSSNTGTNGSPLTVGAAGTIASTTIYVRILATASVAGSPYSGNITLTSTNASQVNVATASSSVNTATLTITGLTANGKTYDATTIASVTGTPAYSGLQNGESFTVTGTVTWSYPSKVIGSQTLSRSGSYNSPSTNYTVTQPSLSATITAATLTVTSTSASNRTYTGTTVATVSGTLSGKQGSDVVTLNTTGTFASKDVANGIAVTSFSIAGADAGNYTLTQPTGVTANITQAPLTISGLTGANKSYTGTSTATTTGTAAYSGLQNGETFSIVGTPTFTFVSVNVGTGITINTTGYQAPSSNYSITQPTLSANITTAPLTITGLTANGKTYDGNTTVSVTGIAAYSGLVNGETYAVIGTPTFAFTTAAAGAGKAITQTGLYSVPTSNYSITQPTLTATISTVALSITASAQSKNFGTTSTTTGATSFTSSGLVNSETIGSVTLAYSGSPAGNLATANAGTYTITPSAATGGTFTASNYTITYNTGTLTINAVVPGAPTISSITPSNQSLSINYTAGTTGGVTITDYKYSTDNGVTFKSAGSTANPLVITTVSSGSSTLVNGTSYNVQIRAVNSVGDGAASASTAATPGLTNSIVNTWITTGNTTAWMTTTNWSLGVTPNNNHFAQYDAQSGSSTLCGITFASNFSILGIELTSNRPRALTIAGTGGSSGPNYYDLTLLGGTLNLTPNVILRNNSASLLTIAENSSGANYINLIMGNNGNNVVNIDGSGGIAITSNLGGASSATLVKGGAGSGDLSLTTGNSYAGKTVISAGYIATSGESAFGTVPVSFVADQITLNGGGVKATGGINFNSTRGITLGATGGLLSPNGNTITLTNVVTGSGGITVTSAGNVSFPSGSTHTYTGTTTLTAGTTTFSQAQCIPNTNNIVVNGGTLVIATNQTINNLSISSGTLTVNAGVTLTINGTLTYTGGTISPTGTIVYGASGALSIGANKSTGIEWTASNTPSSVTVSAGTYTLANNVTTSGSITLSGTGVLDASASNYSVTVGTSWTSYGQAAFNERSSTVTFTGTGTINTTGGENFFILTKSTGGTTTLACNVAIAGTGSQFNLSAGTFDAGTNTFSGTSSTALNISGGTLKLAKLSTTLPEFANTTFNMTGGALELSGTGAQILQGARAYQSLTFSGSGIKTVTSSPSSITGTVTVTGTATLDVSNNSFGGVGTNLTVNSGATYKTAGTSSKPDARGTYTLAATSNVEFTNVEGTQQDIRLTPDAGNVTYGNIIISGSNVGLSTTTASLTLQGGSTFTVANGGTFNVQNTNGFTGNTNTAIKSTNSPTITLSTGSTINYNSASAQVVTGRTDYQNVTCTNAGVKTLSGNTTVNGTLNMASGTLTVGANTLTLNGTVPTRTSGTVDASNSSATVAFTNATAYTLPNGLFTGDINNLTINGGGITLGNNHTISNTLTLTSGNLTVGNNTLALNGNPIAGAGAATNLITTSGSSLSFGGSTAGHFVPASVTALSDLSINNTSNVTLNGNLSIDDSIILINGELNAAGRSLSFQNGGTPIYRTAEGGKLITNASTNLTFGQESGAGTKFTFPEQDFAGDMNLGNLTINRKDSVLLNTKNWNINGSLTLTSGILKVIPGSTLNLYGAANQVSGKLAAGTNTTVNYAQTGSFQSVLAGRYYNLSFNNSGKVLPSSDTVFIANTLSPGTSGQTVTGSAINFNGTGSQTVPSIQYHHLVLSGNRGANNLTLPNGYLNIQGDFVNRCTFSGGSLVNTGTYVYFNGSASQAYRANAAYTYEYIYVYTIGDLNIHQDLGASQRLSLESGTLKLSAGITLNIGDDLFVGSGTINSDDNATILYSRIDSEQDISGAIEYGNLTFNDSKKTFGSRTLSIKGHFNPGAATDHDYLGSTIRLIGSGAQNIYGSTFDKVEVEKSAGSLSVLGDTMKVEGLIKINGGTVNTNNKLKLVGVDNSIYGALIDASTTANGSVVGDILVQRIVEARGGTATNGKAAFYSSPFSDALYSDYQATNRNFFIMTGGNWVRPTMTATIPTGIGFTRRAAKFGENLRISGKPNSGDISPTLSTSAAGTINTLGNPYPSTIDWDLVEKTNIDGDVAYVYNGSSFQVSGGDWDGKISIAQGFQVKAATDASIKFTNACRLETTSSFLRVDAAVARPKLSLHLYSLDGTLNDESFLVLNDKASEGFNRAIDAKKFWPTESINPALGLVKGSDTAVIYHVKSKLLTKAIPMITGVKDSGVYKMELSGQQYFKEIYNFSIFDSKTGASIEITDTVTKVFLAIKPNEKNRYFLNLKDASTPVITEVTNDVQSGILNVYTLDKILMIENYSSQKIEDVKVIGMDGKLLAEGNGQTISLSNASAGVYLVKIQLTEGFKTFKVVLH